MANNFFDEIVNWDPSRSQPLVDCMCCTPCDWYRHVLYRKVNKKQFQPV